MNNVELVKLTNEAVDVAKEIATLLPDVKVLIGGSLALRLQIERFNTRDIHDVDIIIETARKEIAKIRVQALLKLLQKAFSPNSSIVEVSLCGDSYYASISIKGHPVNIILTEIPTESYSYQWIDNIRLQHPAVIRKAKESYNRSKDKLDIKYIRFWEEDELMNSNLPF